MCACVCSRVARGAQLKACELAHPPVQNNQIGNGAALCIGAAIQADQASRSPLPATSAPRPAWARGARSQPSQASHTRMGCAMVAQIPSHTAATGGGGGSGGAICACFARLVLVHLFICLFARAAAASAEPFPQRDRRAGNAQHSPYDMPQHNTTCNITQHHTTCRSTIQRATSHNIIQRHTTRSIPWAPPRRSARSGRRGSLRPHCFVQCQTERAGRRVTRKMQQRARGDVNHATTRCSVGGAAGRVGAVRGPANQSHHRAPRARVWAQAGTRPCGNEPKRE